MAVCFLAGVRKNEDDVQELISARIAEIRRESGPAMDSTSLYDGSAWCSKSSYLCACVLLSDCMTNEKQSINNNNTKEQKTRGSTKDKETRHEREREREKRDRETGEDITQRLNIHSQV